MNQRMLPLLAMTAACFLVAPSDAGYDKSTLASLMRLTRADLSAVSVRYLATRMDVGLQPQLPAQTWSLAWGGEGFRIDVETAAIDSGAPVDDKFVRLWDIAAGRAILYDGFSTAELSAFPAVLHFEDYLPEILGAIGTFPMRTMSGRTPMTNDPFELLAQQSTEVLADADVINGVSCVVVEYRKELPSGPAPFIRAYYAPSLGFAQVRQDILRPSTGATWARWETTSFIDRGADLVALPTAAKYRRWDARGGVESEIDIAVQRRADGAWSITTGNPVDLSFTLPPGTTVIDRDTGKTWMVASDRPSDRLTAGIIAASMSGIGGDWWWRNSWWLGAAVAMVASIASVRGLQRRRRSSAPPGLAPN